MPESYVRLSAGREQMTDELQAMCVLAGANSIFAGAELLTTSNPAVDKDRALLKKLGMQIAELPDVPDALVSTPAVTDTAGASSCG